MARRREFNVVGRNQVRLDGADKVTGRSQFTDDVNLPGMLCGRILRCPLPRARIRSIDTRRAEALPGVKAVVTAEDASGIWVGIHQPLLHATEMYHVGQEVAAVAAIDEDIAREALRLIEVDYEPLPALLTLKEAMADKAPLLHAKAAGNIAWQQAEDHGDPDAAFAAAAHVRTDNYVTHPDPQLLCRVSCGGGRLYAPGKIDRLDADPDRAAVSEKPGCRLQTARKRRAHHVPEYRRRIHRSYCHAPAPFSRRAAVTQVRLAGEDSRQRR